MKLRNKNTGQVWDIPKMRHPTCQEDDISFFVVQGGVGKLFSYHSIAELNADWEDYKPTEPLIKDENIRKAVRAWAEANDIKYIEPCARTSKDNYRIVGFNALGRSFTMEISNEYECRTTFGKALSRKKRGAYTIAELCGEEE